MKKLLNCAKALSILTFCLMQNKVEAVTWHVPWNTENTFPGYNFVGESHLNCANITYASNTSGHNGQLGVIAWDKGQLPTLASPGFVVFDDQGNFVDVMPNRYLNCTSIDVVIGNGITATTPHSIDYRVGVVFTNASGVFFDVYDVTGAGSSSLSAVLVSNVTIASGNYEHARADVIEEVGITSIRNLYGITGSSAATPLSLPLCSKVVMCYCDASHAAGSYVYACATDLNIPPVTRPTANWHRAGVPSIEPDIVGMEYNNTCSGGGGVSDAAVITFIGGDYTGHFDHRVLHGYWYNFEIDGSAAPCGGGATNYTDYEFDPLSSGSGYFEPRIAADPDYHTNDILFTNQIVANYSDYANNIYDVHVLNGYNVPPGGSGPISLYSAWGTSYNYAACIAYGPSTTTQYLVGSTTSANGGNIITGSSVYTPPPFTAISPSIGSDIYQVNGSTGTMGYGWIGYPGIGSPAARYPTIFEPYYSMAMSSSCNDHTQVLVAYEHEFNQLFYKYTGATIGFKPTKPQENNNEQLIVGPNPAEDHITISNAQGAAYVINDMTGREIAKGILQSDTENIDIENLSKGVYIISVSKENKTEWKRLVKK